MSNTFFPIKLLDITVAMHPHVGDSTAANTYLNMPDDGKDRHVLCSPTVNRLTKPEGTPFNTRMRLALLHNDPMLDAAHYRLERYVDGELVESTGLVELDDALASAIEAEIYNFLLRKQGKTITLM